MASRKAAEIGIGEARWLSKSQAMAWVGIQTEAKFDDDWKPYLNLHDNGGKGGRYDKQQIDAFMEYRKAIQGKPFEEWHHKITGTR
jgi:hypothetical protein